MLPVQIFLCILVSFLRRLHALSGIVLEYMYLCLEEFARHNKYPDINMKKYKFLFGPPMQPEGPFKNHNQKLESPNHNSGSSYQNQNIYATFCFRSIKNQILPCSSSSLNLEKKIPVCIRI